MQIESIPTSDIVAYEFNNRTHPEEQIQRIAKSITEFGFIQPLVVDDKNSLIVGHGRLYAAQRLKHQTVPCVRVKNLTDVQIKALRIIDNKLQNDSRWDFNNVELEFGFLEDHDFDLTPYGLEELANLFGDPTAGNVATEWQDMPEFIQPDASGVQQIVVHFMSRGDVERFAELMNQQITEKTKSIWFPEIKPEDLLKLKIVDAA